MHSWKFEAIGTHWSIETTDEVSDETRQKITACIDAFDEIYSRFRDDSLVAKISHQAGEYQIGEDSPALSVFYRKIHDITGSAVTPWIGAGLVAGGYDKEYSLTPAEPTPAPKWDDDIRWTGEKLVTKKPVLMDVGAAGKGLLVDKISQLLEREGFDNFVVDASGDICVRGNTQRIGLENPYDSTKVIGVLEVKNASLCASAPNRRSWASGWHHILDGKTGRPTNNVVATWVVASDTMTADGVATALFFVSPNELREIGDFQCVRLMADGKIEKSDNFVGQLYI